MRARASSFLALVGLGGLLAWPSAALATRTPSPKERRHVIRKLERRFDVHLLASHEAPMVKRAIEHVVAGASKRRLHALRRLAGDRSATFHYEDRSQVLEARGSGVHLVAAARSSVAGIPQPRLVHSRPAAGEDVRWAARRWKPPRQDKRARAFVAELGKLGLDEAQDFQTTDGRVARVTGVHAAAGSRRVLFLTGSVGSHEVEWDLSGHTYDAGHAGGSPDLLPRARGVAGAATTARRGG
jgi:hypothetical protein